MDNLTAPLFPVSSSNSTTLFLNAPDTVGIALDSSSNLSNTNLYSIDVLPTLESPIITSFFGFICVIFYFIIIKEKNDIILYT